MNKQFCSFEGTRKNTVHFCINIYIYINTNINIQANTRHQPFMVKCESTLCDAAFLALNGEKKIPFIKKSRKMSYFHYTSYLIIFQ